MPIKIIDVDAGRGNILIGSGILTGKEYCDALEMHLQQDEEKYKEYRYSLTDLTAVTHVKELPTGDIEKSVNLCKQSAKINPDAIVAIVANKDILFGLSRMWEILMDGKTGWDIMVFKTRDAAKIWIREKAKEKFGIENLQFN